MEMLNDLLNQVANIGTGALIVLAVVVAGYVVKAIPFVPNGLIPLVTLAVAVTANVLLGEVGSVSPSTRHPEIRLGMVGFLYWGVGWLLHNQGLSRLEKLAPAWLKPLLGASEPPPKPDPAAPDPRDRPGWTKE